MPIPHQQFLGANGAPLAGGFVYTYIAGTSTPAPTYLDYTGTSLNTNPITLDAGGFASIWIPTGTIDVAVFNSSNVQQYKVLSVTALPSTISSLTANYFQSSTVNPALSGFIRAANTDGICWRNSGNSADLCLNIMPSSILSFGGANFSFLNEAQTWTQPQIFNGIEVNTFGWLSGTTVESQFTHSDTAPRTYNFPDASGTVCLSVSCSLTSPTINNVVVGSVPTDFDDYTENSVAGVATPVTLRTNTIPAGALTNGAAVGSIMEIETSFIETSHTGSAAGWAIFIAGIDPINFTVADGTSYDVKCTVNFSSLHNPFFSCLAVSSAGAVVAMNTGHLGTIITPVAVTIVDSFTTSTTVTGTSYFEHVRIRK